MADLEKIENEQAPLENQVKPTKGDIAENQAAKNQVTEDQPSPVAENTDPYQALAEAYAQRKAEQKAKDMLQRLFEYYYANPQELPEDFQPQMSFDGLERTVCDYIAGMTDNYAVDKFTEIFIPTGWNVRG